VADPFLGEIRLFGGNFAPVAWAFCNGQLLSISENSALYSLLGTTYGGDGVQTFGLPNLQGRLPLHQGQLAGGSNYPIGQLAGSETVTLIGNQIGAHGHAMKGGVTATSGSPANAVPGTSAVGFYLAAGSGGPLNFNAGSVQANVGGQPHDNMMPYLALSFIIATEGIFPSQN